MMHTKADKRRWYTLQCRYYNGEPCSPTDIEKINGSLLWDYERLWVEWSVEDSKDIEGFKREAKCHHLTLAEGDKTPLTLKTLLFNRYLHWCGGYEPIEQEIRNFELGFYADYLKRKTNRERRTDSRRMKLIPKCRLYRGEAENPYAHSKNEILWQWEKEWAEALADSYSNRERFFQELMSTNCLGCCPLPYWKDIAHNLGMPATLLACFGKNFGASYHGFTHEMDSDFVCFLKDYAKT